MKQTQNKYTHSSLARLSPCRIYPFFFSNPSLPFRAALSPKFPLFDSNSVGGRTAAEGTGGEEVRCREAAMGVCMLLDVLAFLVLQQLSS
jgi:hypothetical protein